MPIPTTTPTTTPTARPVRPAAPAARPAAPAQPKPPAPDQLALSPAALRASAAKLWSEALEPEDAEGPFYRVERDPYDANPIFEPRERQAQAKALAARQTPAERAKLGDLHDSLLELRYDQIAACTAKDPVARVALQVLLLEDRLFAPGPRRDPRDLGHALADLTKQPLDPAIDRDALISDLVQELAEPASINQWVHATCTVTTAQIRAAIERPADLVRVVGGLASPAGRATLPDGTVLERAAGTTKPGLRTHAGALWQGALMELGNGAATYDDKTDLSDGKGRGLSAEEFARVLDALDGRPHRVTWAHRDGAAAVTEAVERGCTQGGRVPVALRWGLPGPDGKLIHGNHAVLVTRVAADRVTYLNPHGAEQSMSREAFAQRIHSAILPK